MILTATDAQGDVIVQETYYSVGGGFVLTEAELAAGSAKANGAPVPYPFKPPPRCWRCAPRRGKSVADLKRTNELTRMSATELDDGLETHLEPS